MDFNQVSQSPGENYANPKTCFFHVQEPVETIRAKIEVIQDDSTKIPPLIGYFSSGYDPCKNKNSPPSVKVFKNKARSNRLQVAVKPSGSNVEFMGTSFFGEAASAQLCRYSLGVLDKETRTLKILPIASNKIIRLVPQFRSSESSECDNQSSKTAELPTAEKRKAFKYQSKEAINRGKKKEELNQKVDQKILEEKLKNITFDKVVALESTSLHSALLVPPYDSCAATPQDTYPLDKIISSGEWAYLEDIYYLLDKGAEIETNAYPTFVRNRLHKLQDIKDNEERKTLCCILSYITHLVKFNDMFFMDRFRNNAKHHKTPLILKHKFESMFGDPKAGKRLPADKFKLLTSYVLVLTLHADGFQTDPSDIANDLGKSSVVVREEFEHIGCKLSKNTPLFAMLPVPIKFPVQTRARKRPRG